MIEAPTRALGFLLKEIVAVVRQPRLILGLVLGPFLIMLLFGLGYRGPRPQLRTILVLPDEPEVAEQVDIFTIYRQGLSGVFQLNAITHDRERALAQLAADEADMVVVVPDNLYEQLRAGQQGRLVAYYAETDPTSNAWVRYFTAEQTSDLNRRIVASVIRQSRAPATQILDYSQQVLAITDEIESDLRSRDTASARRRAEQLAGLGTQVPAGAGDDVDRLGASLGVTTAEPGASTTWLADLRADVEQLRQALAADDVDAAVAQLQRIRQQARRVNDLAGQINAIPVETLVSPLVGVPENVAPVEPTPVAFYTPGVLALLLQHIAVTLSSLSGVRDRLLGTLELFRVSPVRPAEILIGKSLGFGIVLALVAAALTFAVTGLLDVPQLGAPTYYWLSLGLVIFAGLGLGFALSMVAATETQAVQLSMLVLLASVFFGGFFLPTDLLFAWVRIVSYALPVSYGAINLRDIMLRGADPEWQFLVGPALLGTAFFVLALLGQRRQMRRA